MTSIRFDRVSKQFTLQQDRPRSFQELFLNLFRRNSRPSKEKYWALKDVSFEIREGEVVGILGDNGVGKSTALKLMSRIIEPTSGTIEVNGRVGALLELGAGFHPDLTGRENVYLNGSILGFSKEKMGRIFDDILDFSEMERFIDVPVKHYSSGMYMRLAFAIAIHLKPDILLIDEILAVGDQAFQLRCMDKINEMKRQGLTMVIVTHALGVVRDLCDRAIWLDEGKIQAEGSVEHVLQQYTTQVMAHDRKQILEAEKEKSDADGDSPDQEKQSDESSWRWGSREAEIVAVQILNGQLQEQRIFQTGDSLTVRMHYEAHESIQEPRFGLALFHSSGFHINGPNNVFSDYAIAEIEGQGFVDYTIDRLPLLPGTYHVSVAIHDHEGKHPYDHIHQRLTFRVRAGGVREEFGTFYIPANWNWSPTPDSDPPAGKTQ